ncbi:MAG: hypothetical protein V3U69_01530 [Bacteroidota bacterium]
MKRGKPILYIDVDGVLLVDGGPLSPDGRARLRPCAREFLEYSTEQFDCRWLTGWHYNDERSHIEELYELYLKPAGVRRTTFSRIGSHDWKFMSDMIVDKLNSLNFEDDIYVIDDLIVDHIIHPECPHRFLKIHPTRPYELMRILKILKKIVEGQHSNAR